METQKTKQCSVLLEDLKLSETTENDTNINPRKSKRSRQKPNKFGEFLEYEVGKKTLDNINSDNESSEDEVLTLIQQKKTTLFSTDDVEGQDMFMFKSRHTKNDLQNKVLSTIYSPKIESHLKTPRKSRNSMCSPFSKVVEATPKHVKDIMKKRIIQQVDSDTESDFSASSSDFNPDESSHDESASSDNSSISETAEVDVKPERKQQIKKARNVKAKTKDTEYFVTSDNYFMMHSSKKITTSDHTLERLKNLNMADSIEDKQIQMTEEHKKRVNDLNKSYERLFNKWLYVLSENYNIVLYGVGSKKPLLQQFVQQKLKQFPCIVVNGFFPSLTVKSILEAILVDLLDNVNVPTNISDVVSIIDTQLKASDVHLFLIVHNIDGTMLRSSKAQNVLASLSQIENVHMLASIDHINGSLLWDHSKLSKFNFTWWDVTTFKPYCEETSFENSLMYHKSGSLQLASLRSVYQSLTSNAKGIFNIIIQYQLDNHKQSHYQGLPFRELYSKCREHFLVSSDVALRAQLTEFLDHKLIKMKRSYDGSENLVIPIDNTLLQQFLEQQNV